MNKPLILVVEDDSSVKNLITTTLKAHDYRHLTAPNGKAAILEASSHNPDIVLLDLGLPDIDGVDVIKKIRTWSNMPIIVISARSEDTDKIDALDAGADDYLTKPFGVMELISRVKALLRRVGGMEEEKFIRIGLLFIDDEKHVAYVDDKPVELTFKEYELLRYLAINQGIVLSRDNLMEKVWSLDYEGESRTLDVHIKTLRQKLGVVGCYIKTVRNVGYYLDVDDRG